MKMEIWEMLTPEAIPLLMGESLLTHIIRSSDPRPVVDQVNDRYSHGGGWRKFEGFKWDREAMTIEYPEDPVYHAAARCEVSPTETVYVFPFAWVLIDRGGDDWEIARLD